MVFAVCDSLEHTKELGNNSGPSGVAQMYFASSDCCEDAVNLRGSRHDEQHQPCAPASGGACCRLHCFLFLPRMDSVAWRHRGSAPRLRDKRMRLSGRDLVHAGGAACKI